MKLKRFDEGIWFDYPDAEEVRFKIRAFTGKALSDMKAKSKIGKIAVEMPYPDPKDSNKKQIDIVDDFDDAKFEWESFKYSLQEWKGIEIEDDLKATDDQILEAIFNNQKMHRFIVQKAFEVLEAESRKFLEEIKNLVGSLSGSSTEKMESPVPTANKSI